ncbi:hypothetical protein Q604_UNBC18008G0001, partial [human gut metagenome]
ISPLLLIGGTNLEQFARLDVKESNKASFS